MVKSGYCTLHRRSFLKDRLFSIFLPVFTVDKVCHVSNKFRSPRNLRTQYFQTRDFIIHLHLEDSLKIHLSFFFSKSNSPCLSQRLLEASIFYHMFTSFDSVQVYNISNKNQLPNRSVKYLLFTQQTLHTSFIFKEN